MNPAKVLPILGLLFLLLGCKVTRLSGKYPEPPFSVVTNKNFDQTWDKVIDIFSENGISIETIEKASGIIVSTKQSFFTSKTWTYEKNKEPIDNGAWVIIPRINKLRPVAIEGKFNIRIKSEGSGTMISVNLFNLEAKSHKHPSPKWGYYDVASTGVFENLIIARVK